MSNELINFLIRMFPKHAVELESYKSETKRSKDPITYKVIEGQKAVKEFSDLNRLSNYLGVAELSAKACLANSGYVWVRKRRGQIIYRTDKVSDDDPRLWGMPTKNFDPRFHEDNTYVPPRSPRKK